MEQSDGANVYVIIHEGGGNMGDGFCEKKALKAAQRGDTGAFEAIVTAYEKLLINIAFRLTGNREDAEDAACEAFIKAHKNIRTCKGSLKPWLCAITRNCCYDLLRRRKEVIYIDQSVDGEESVFLQIPDDDDTPEAAFLRGERAVALEAAINTLKPAFRELIVLIGINGLSYQEAAYITKLPEGTVKSRLNRAREALKRQMRIEN